LVEQAGNSSTVVARLDDVPSTLYGAASFAVANALAAVAACRAQGASVEEVRLGLSSFRNQEHNPGRLNLYRVRRGYAVIDYGHNIGAYEEACRLARRFAPCPTAAVISVPGDRPNGLIKAIGRTVARGFDRIALKDDDDRRGRESLEVPSILADAILDERALAVCTVSDDEQRAIRQTIATMREREVVFIFTDQAKRAAAFLEQMGGVPVERIDEAVVERSPRVRLAG
jgi:cyanophycin synthetase